MSARFSFSYRSCCCLFLVIGVSLFHLCLSNKSFDDDSLCLGSERQALLQFKHGLIDEAGRLASWDDGEENDCCKWVGIGCDNITGHVHHIHLPALNGHCNLPALNGHVHLIHLPAPNGDRRFYYTPEAPKQRLRGKLSSSLLHLKQLSHLDLSCNDFEGRQVPKFVGSLGNLRYLNLSGSNFRGMMPPQLGNLSKLHVLCLGSFYRPYETRSVMNNMEWLSSLHLLQHLDLSGVDLSKSINWLQVINTIPSLVQLYLSNCQLSDIHPQVASVNLTSLSLLDLSNNHFDSPLPQWFFSITSLVSLDLSSCKFHGPTPDNIGFRNLTSLESLNVGDNSFMKSSLVLGDLSSVGSNLITLDISNCGISSHVFNSLHNLTSLRSFDLSENQLTRKIPKSLGCNFCNLRDLDLSGNDFGNLSLTSLLVESVFMCKSPHLESLILWSSGLSGSIPDSIGQLSFLRSLDLNSNKISCPIPSSIGRLSSLEVLDLSNNQLNGSVPYSIGRLSLLKELDLSYNQLNGGLPHSIGQLSSLKLFYFSNNQLNGVVTEAHFSKLVNLKQLYGEGNNLTLRPTLANWIPPFQLQYLYLISWVLGPQIPLWLQSQKDLKKLDISNTGISSPMPSDSFWRSFPNLYFLNMSHNHIRGTLKFLDIPSTLELLDLNSNELSGELTPISKLSVRNVLDMSNNSFFGSLHDFLCSNGVKHTGALYLENNHFSGGIPECWEKWPELFFLNLENNNFSGVIPTTLGFLSRLQSLNMRGNKLSGRLPDSLMNLTRLKILQLGRNELVGSIPSWFGTHLSQLSILNLRSNSFDGIIPHKLCLLEYIQILDLAHNNLSGNIPRCFNNFSILTRNETISNNEIFFFSNASKIVMGSDSLVMKGREDTYSTILGLVTLLDLSCNNLVGNIPSELTSLKALQTLNLSRNQLTGGIPKNIGDMKELSSFDLSVNMLSGELPMSLSSLNFLGSFNVSHNNLTGRIPSSTQLQTFSKSCFFSNKLCGLPLTESCVHVEEVPKKTDSDQQEDGGADWGLIVSSALGFVSGFWIIVAPLMVSKSWRIAYFGFLSKVRYMVCYGMHKYCFNMFFK